MSEWDDGFHEGFETGSAGVDAVIARADRLEALLREARDEITEIEVSGIAFADEYLKDRIDAELHGGDPTPPADA